MCVLCTRVCVTTHLELRGEEGCGIPSSISLHLFPWEKVHHWTRILTFWLDWLTSHLHCPQYFLKCLTLGLLLSWWLYILVLGFHLLWWLYTVFHWILYRPPKVSSGHTGFLVFVKVFTKKKKAMIVVLEDIHQQTAQSCFLSSTLRMFTRLLPEIFELKSRIHWFKTFPRQFKLHIHPLAMSKKPIFRLESRYDFQKIEEWSMNHPNRASLLPRFVAAGLVLVLFQRFLCMLYGLFATLDHW